MARIDREALTLFSTQVLAAAGVSGEDARALAALLVKSDLQGYAAHGTAVIPTYLDRIRQGLIRLDADPIIVRETKTTAVIDGQQYVGQIVALRAMRMAIEKAKEHDVGVVCLRRAGHIGRLADYVELASDAGMVGVAMVSVGGGNIAPHGGMEPIAGTNPIAFGVPARDGPVLIDFATASMSARELQRRVRHGEPIPPGVLLDGSGLPTTDYAAYVGPPRGVMLPFGGHKGSAIHLMAEILGGVLSGNGLGFDLRDSGGPAINAAFFQAISVEAFGPMDEFLDKMEDLRSNVRSRKPAPGFDSVRVPGDGSRARAEVNERDGVPVDDAAWADLIARAAQLGVTDVPEPITASRATQS
ncbi:MAG: Ldh family oxidoreductase [Chloroflexi bacterium]|nr:Ldh family oxidoreductase [Chloroflexota bacterium]